MTDTMGGTTTNTEEMEREKGLMPCEKFLFEMTKSINQIKEIIPN